MADNEYIHAVTNSWGFDLVLSEKATQDLLSETDFAKWAGTAIGGALATAGIVTGPVGAVIALALAGAFAAKRLQVEIVDEGKGVHFPVSWPQFALISATAALGNPLSMLFIAPLPN